MLTRFDSVYRAIGRPSTVAACVLVVMQAGSIASAQSAAPQNTSPPSVDPQSVGPQSVGRQSVGQLSMSEWAERLDAGDFARREAAMMHLWANYAHSRDAVRALAEHSDPEVAKRAEWILKRWRIGLLPELPEAIKRRLASAEGSPASALLALLDGGYLPQAVEVVRHQSGSGDEVRKQMVALVTLRYVSLLHMARENDQLDSLLELLDLCSDTNSLVASRAVLLARLGREIDEASVLPACASTWPPARRDEAAIVALAVLGDFERAAGMAERAQRADLLATVLLLDGRWDQLARVARDAADPNLPVEASIDQHAMWLMASNEALRSEAVSNQADLEVSLREATEKMRSATVSADLRWQSLTVAGQFDAAIEVAKEINPTAAADLMAARQEMAAAMQVLGVDPAAPEPDLDRMLQSVADQWSAAAATPEVLSSQTEALEPLLTSLRLLRAIGDQTTVAPTLRRIAALSDPQGSKSLARREAAMLALRMGMDDLVPELVAGESDPFGGEIGMYLSFALADQSPGFFTALGGALQTTRPEASSSERVADAIELLAGRVPQGWDRQVDLDALYRGFGTATPAPDTRLGLLRARANVGGSQSTFMAGDFFAELGRSDLAERTYAAAAERDDPMAAMRYADVLLSAGRASDALRYYQRAYENLQSNRVLWPGAWTRPYGSPEPSTASALAGQAVALGRLGRDSEAADLWATLDLVPLNPAGDLGRDYVERLGTLDMPERQRTAALYHLRFGAFERNTDRNFRSTAVAHALRMEKVAPEAAALWTRIGVMGSIHVPPTLYPSGYVTIPAQWHVFDAIAAARRGDSQATLTGLERSLEYYPLNITMAEDELPKIREAGMTEEANRILDRVFETGVDYLQRFPRDANTANNVAWIAAINGRRYEDALELARQAVFLVPDSTSYRDTLAEVLLRLGRKDQALAVEHQCLLDEPDLWHLHEQVHRIRSGDAIGSPSAPH